MKRGPRFLFRGHRLLVDHRLRDLGERSIGCLFFVQRFLKQEQARTQPQSSSSAQSAIADSGQSRTVIPTHRGQRSGDRGQLPVSV
jgi:hypothetical protein